MRVVHENHVPIYLVEMIEEVVDIEFAMEEEEVVHMSTLVPKLVLHPLNQFRYFADLGGVSRIIRLYIWVFLFELGNVELALIKEDGAAVTI